MPHIIFWYTSKLAPNSTVKETDLKDKIHVKYFAVSHKHPFLWFLTSKNHIFLKKKYQNTKDFELESQKFRKFALFSMPVSMVASFLREENLGGMLCPSTVQLGLWLYQFK